MLDLRRPCLAEGCSRGSQVVLNVYCERVRATEHLPRDPFRVLERRHGLAEMVERRAVLVERLCVAPSPVRLLPSEIKLYVEPEALNQEHNAQNHSNFGFGWHPMNLRVGHQENVSQFSGDVRRQHFSLFASDPTEKHAWHTTLNTVTNSSREWAYVGHEIKDSCAYITGKKK